VPGAAASYTVTVGAVNGFASDVSLSLSGLSASQASWTLSPAAVAGGAGPSALTVTTASTLAPGTYGLTITGSSGATSHTVSVNLVVAGDFTLTVSPASLSLSRGKSGSYTVAVAPSGGFNGNVSLSVTGLPSGATATFSRNPVAAPGSSVLNVRTTGSTSRGTFMVKITGKNGSLIHQATATLKVT
jgi:uncharacterized membrane protein